MTEKTFIVKYVEHAVSFSNLMRLNFVSSAFGHEKIICTKSGLNPSVADEREN